MALDVTWFIRVEGRMEPRSRGGERGRTRREGWQVRVWRRMLAIGALEQRSGGGGGRGWDSVGGWVGVGVQRAGCSQSINATFIHNTTCPLLFSLMPNNFQELHLNFLAHYWDRLRNIQCCVNFLNQSSMSLNSNQYAICRLNNNEASSTNRLQTAKTKILKQERFQTSRAMTIDGHIDFLFKSHI